MRVFYFKGFYALSHLRSDINVHWILFFKVVGNGICQMRNFWKFSYFPKSADGCIWRNLKRCAAFEHRNCKHL